MSKHNILMVNYKPVGIWKNFVIDENKNIQKLYYMGSQDPILYMNGPTTRYLKVELDYILDFSIYPNLDLKNNHLSIALTSIEKGNAYTTDGWLQSFTNSNSNGELVFLCESEIKEDPIWYRKLKIKAFW